MSSASRTYAQVMVVGSLETPYLDAIRARQLEPVITATHEVTARVASDSLGAAVLACAGSVTLARTIRGELKGKTLPLLFVTSDEDVRRHVFEGALAGLSDVADASIAPTALAHKVSSFVDVHRSVRDRDETLRLNDELLAVIGHDLRNPVSTIIMTAKLLAEDSRDERVLKAARRLESSGTRMLKMLEEIFDLSRSRLSGGIPIAPAPANLRVITERVLLEVQKGQPTGRFVVRATGDLSGEWDGTRLEQVVANLVGNALRHGGKDAPVTVTLVGDGDVVGLDVHNEGHMPPEVLARLFSPFTAGEGQKRRADALGLGLYITKQLVLAHGGTIDVTSAPSDGTLVRVKLPRRASVEA